MCSSSSGTAAAAAAVAAAVQAPLFARNHAIRQFRALGLSGELVNVSPDKFFSTVAALEEVITVLFKQDGFALRYAAEIGDYLFYTETNSELELPDNAELSGINGHTQPGIYDQAAISIVCVCLLGALALVGVLLASRTQPLKSEPSSSITVQGVEYSR